MTDTHSTRESLSYPKTQLLCVRRLFVCCRKICSYNSQRERARERERVVAQKVSKRHRETEAFVSQIGLKSFLFSLTGSQICHSHKSLSLSHTIHTSLISFTVSPLHLFQIMSLSLCSGGCQLDHNGETLKRTSRNHAFRLQFWFHRCPVTVGWRKC